jgi:hypothetical protein
MRRTSKKFRERRAKAIEMARLLSRKKKSGEMCPGQIGRGKYAGLTIPQVFFVDLDYFYYGLNSGLFRGSTDFAKEMARRARHIRPPPGREDWKFGLRFDGQPILRAVMLLRPDNSRKGCIVVPHLACDIYHDCGLPQEDSLRVILDCIVRLYFGGQNPRHSHLDCEQFFTTDRNFALSCEHNHRQLVAQIINPDGAS